MRESKRVSVQGVPEVPEVRRRGAGLDQHPPPNDAAARRPFAPLHVLIQRGLLLQPEALALHRLLPSQRELAHALERQRVV